jgi:hypothetical protein
VTPEAAAHGIEVPEGAAGAAAEAPDGEDDGGPADRG